MSIWQGLRYLFAVWGVWRGHAERICEPGNWRVWRDGDTIFSETFDS